MTADEKPRTIGCVDVRADTFAKSWKRIRDHARRQEVMESVRLLLFLDLDAAPRKLHLHQLKNKRVQSRVDPSKRVAAWTIHVTRDDTYKASFTLEDGVAYMRLVDEHDVIDSDP